MTLKDDTADSTEEYIFLNLLPISAAFPSWCLSWSWNVTWITGKLIPTNAVSVWVQLLLTSSSLQIWRPYFSNHKYLDRSLIFVCLISPSIFTLFKLCGRSSTPPSTNINRSTQAQGYLFEKSLADARIFCSVKGMTNILEESCEWQRCD